MTQSIEEIFIDYIASSLPLFSQQQSAYRFQCPYCQSSGKNSKGKSYASSDAKGYLYSYGNAWNYKCHKCGEHQSFVKFLEAQFPLLHFEYVRLRDQLGTTGFQTNCPSLETLLRKQGMLSFDPLVFGSPRQHQQPQHIPQAPVARPTPASASTPPKVTKLPPMRSPQQQAGHQSRLNHLVKQRQQRKRREPGDSWLS
jgi:DNA-directed RNA polymerase subunit RPC12/RpoP